MFENLFSGNVLSSTDSLSFEEKVDYIYSQMRAQKRNARLKLSIKIIFVLALYYFFVTILPTISDEKINEYKTHFATYIAKEVSVIAKPLMEEMMKDMVKNASQGVLPEGTSINTSKVQELLQKHPELKSKLK